jgi:hypothetical protein
MRVLAPERAIQHLEAVIRGLPFSYECGGLDGADYPYSAITTVFLAARVAGLVHFAAAAFPARADYWSPGPSWPELAPWRNWRDAGPRRREGPAGGAVAKWAAWAARPYVIGLECGEVDAFLEADYEHWNGG